MGKAILVVAYVFASFAAISFTAIVPNLISLGMQEEVAEILDVVLTTLVSALGAVGLYFGLQLPEVRRRTEPEA